MLLVHPSSTCDVCLDGYNWTIPTSTPHAISCGHVFCLQCLRSTQPSACPLCRKAFLPERIKKLHVDRYMPGTEDNTDASRVNEFLQKIALVSGENTPSEDILTVIQDAEQWLGSRASGNRAILRPLRKAAEALVRHSEIMHECRELQDALEKQTEDFQHEFRKFERDLQMSQTVENGLLEQLNTLEGEYKTRLTRAERSLEEAETEISHLRVEHTHLRAELAKCQDILNSLPPPSAPGHLKTRSLEGDASSKKQLNHSAYEKLSRGQANVTFIPSEPLAPPCVVPNGLSGGSKEPTDDIFRHRERKTRPPVMVPGAPLSRKVVPPYPDPRRARRESWHSDYPEKVVDTNSMDAERQHTEVSQSNHRPSVVSNQAQPYTYLPTGYIPQSGESRGHSRASSSSSGSDESNRDRSMLYGTARDPFWPGSAPQSSALSLPGADAARAPRSNGHHTAFEPPVSTALSLYTPSVPDSMTSSSTVSLTDLGLLAARPGAESRRRSSSETPYRAIQDVLRDEPSSPEPSPASSWGTVHSIDRSNNSSLQDLTLLGLAGGTGVASPAVSIADLNLTSLPQIAISQASSSTTRSDRELSELPVDPPGTPRVIPWNRRSISTSGLDMALVRTNGGDAHSSASDEAVNALTPRPRSTTDRLFNEQESHGFSGSGLGLTFDAVTTLGHALGRNVNGEGDLQDVDRSLMELIVNSETVSDSRRHRHTRHASMSDGEGSSRPLMRAITDLPRSSGSTHDGFTPQPRAFNRSLSGTSVPLLNDRSIGPVRVADETEYMETRPDRNRHRRHSSMTMTTTRSTSYNDHMRHGDEARASPYVSGLSDVHTGSASTASAIHWADLPPASRDESPSLDSPTFLQSVNPPLGESSLLLSFNTLPGPISSTAMSATGEPTTIRVPQPINSRHTGNIFGFWNSRNAR